MDAPRPVPVDLATARAAKKRFALQYRHLDWCRGYGIAPQGDGYVLRINVEPGTAPTLVPEAFEGVPVVAVGLAGYAAR